MLYGVAIRYPFHLPIYKIFYPIESMNRVIDKKKIMIYSRQLKNPVNNVFLIITDFNYLISYLNIDIFKPHVI